jgi:hypothetical protein
MAPLSFVVFGLGLVVAWVFGGFSELEATASSWRNIKSDVVVHARSNCYDFGTHSEVLRSTVQEYQIFGKEPSLPPIKSCSRETTCAEPHERKSEGTGHGILQ